MKLIDKNGKIFGRFNVIDFCIVIILIAMIAAVGYKLFIQNNTDNTADVVVQHETKTVEVTLLVEKIPMEVKEKIKKGDRIIINNEITDAKVVHVESANSKSVTNDDQGNLKVVENPLLHDLKVSVKLDADVSDASVIFMDKTLKSNIDFPLETKSFYANSKVVDVVIAK